MDEWMDGLLMCAQRQKHRVAKHLLASSSRRMRTRTAHGIVPPGCREMGNRRAGPAKRRKVVRGDSVHHGPPGQGRREERRVRGPSPLFFSTLCVYMCYIICYVMGGRFLFFFFSSFSALSQLAGGR